MKITLGAPEILLVLSGMMLINNMLITGWVFFSLGIIGTLARFGIDHAEKLEREKKNTEFEKELKSIIEKSGIQNNITDGNFPRIVH